MPDDEKFMHLAIKLAKRGKGFTSPNPMVGAVVVKNGEIIGKGYHKKYGDKHAEIVALDNVKYPPFKATLYVNLEPCNHYGKTPPCVPYIIKKGIKKVVISMIDPNPIVSGKGIRALKSAGIEVVNGVLEEKAKELNEFYIKFITTGTPYVIMKTAMTLDGKIATSNKKGEYILCENSLHEVHKLRGEVDAIIVGIGTILYDDPQLTVRIGNNKWEMGNGKLEVKSGERNPVRVILDTKLRLPISAKVCREATDGKTIIATTKKVDKEKCKILQDMGCKIIKCESNNEGKIVLKELLKTLADERISSVIIEGGSEVNFSALKENVVDKVIVFISPKIIGGNSAPTLVGGAGVESIKDAFCLRNIKIKKIGSDIRLEGYVNK